MARTPNLTLRDEEIVDTIARLGALTTRQVARAHFPRLRSSRRLAQARMRALWLAGRVGRTVSERQGDYVWTPAKRHYGDLAHRLAVSQVWCDAGFPSEWECEFTIGDVRADALFWIAGKPWLLEVERSSRDLAGKMQAYTALLRGHREWRAMWSEFPKILLVVNTPLRVQAAEALASPPKVVCTPGGVQRVMYG